MLSPTTLNCNAPWCRASMHRGHVKNPHFQSSVVDGSSLYSVLHVNSVWHWRQKFHNKGRPLNS